MAKDFIRMSAATEIPTEKDAQIRIILEGRVYDAVYNKFMSTAPIARLTDYGTFFSVTFADLVEYLKAHPAEIERLLPWETQEYREGLAIVRNADGTYELREREKGFVTAREAVQDLSNVIDEWLRRHLVNQALRSFIPKP